MPEQNLCFVAELTPQEEVEFRALEASIWNIHKIATTDSENAKRASKSILSIRQDAERGLEALQAVNLGKLDARTQRDYQLQIELFTRTLAAVNKVRPQRPM